ncbi:hypothetical protein D7Y21_15850 [Corallococcus sp. AB045]|nr:hypothetical protein D7Y21_15850 [Corallococcus sp. AB045]
MQPCLGQCWVPAPGCPRQQDRETAHEHHALNELITTRERESPGHHRRRHQRPPPDIRPKLHTEGGAGLLVLRNPEPDQPHDRIIWRGVEGLPKGGHERAVELLASVDALKPHQHLRGRFVFRQEGGRPLTKGKMAAPLSHALRAAGVIREVGQIGWHDLRHSYGSHLAMRGVPLKVIEELMGHSTIEMTTRDAYLSPDTRRAAVSVLDQPLAPACDTGGGSH